MTSKDRNILIAMDGSHFSAYAFDWYTRNMIRSTDNVIIVHCPEYRSITSTCSPIEKTEPTVIVDLYHEEQEQIREFVESLGQRLKDNNIGGKVRCENGIPGHVIVKVADEEDASIIITGSRGLGTIRRTFLGSTSDFVMHHSPVPVVVCRHRHHYGHHGHKHGSHTKYD